MDAIHAATVASSHMLALAEELGTIEPGKIADRLGVSGNPLQDITALENVAVVIKDGKLVR
ncbi:MAG: amidohydrolase family protein [Gammaproteobacteria bacterium]|nr:amidohydrolase family protein [Gammaproteobacteria bacterium]